MKEEELKLHTKLSQYGVSSIYDLDCHSLNELIYHALNNDTNLYNFVIEELSKKTDLYGDHKGSWQGIPRPEKVEGGIDAVVINHTEKLNFLYQLKARFIFNILGDGTDETIKIQNFLDSLEQGEIAYFPKGTYKFKSLRIKDKHSITIMGETEIPDYNGGQNATKFICLGGVPDAIMLDGAKGCVFKNIELTYENYIKGNVDYNGIGLNLEGSPQSKVQNCVIHGFDTAIRLHSLGVMKISDNRIFNCNNGIYGKECGDSEYLNNYIYDIAMDKEEEWLNLNDEKGCAMSLAYSGNSIIQGGKIEWCGKGISLLDTHGDVINAIVFDFNRGFDIRTRKTKQDYIYDKNRPIEHIQNYYKYSSYDNKITNCTFNGSGHFGKVDNLYGSNIVLYKSSDTIINSNTFSYASWQSYANNFGDNPLVESGNEEIRRKSGAKISFIKLIDSPNIIITGNSFNSAYNTIPVLINDIDNIVTSCLYDCNNSYSAYPTTNKNRGQFYTIDSVGRKILYLDNPPTETQGTYSYMDTIIYFSGNGLKTVYCTSNGTIKPLNDLYVFTDETKLNCVYCQNRDITENDLVVGDYLTIDGQKVRITGFYKQQWEGNTWIKLNTYLNAPVNGVKVELTYPSFSE